MTTNRHDGPDPSEVWSVEPVRDAIVAARMRDLRNGHGDDFSALDARAVEAGPEAAVARRGVLRAVRARVGRALVAFGAYVEGPCDCPDSAGVGAGAV
jgi:hypothetical protein